MGMGFRAAPRIASADPLLGKQGVNGCARAGGLTRGSKGRDRRGSSYGLMRKYYRRIVWRAIRRLKLYRPRAALRPHMARLLLGVVRVDRMMRRAHKHSSTPAPSQS